MWYAFKSIVVQLRMRNIHKTFHVRESMAHWSFRFTLVVTLQTWLWRHTPGCDVTRIPAFIQDGGSWRTTGLSFVEINVVVLHKNRFIYLNCPMAVTCSIRKYQTKVLKKPRSDILPYNDQAVQVNKRFCYLCPFSVSLSDVRNVRLYYPYWQYTDLFIFRFVSLLCLRSTLRLLYD